jgi:hypothetical protein
MWELRIQFSKQNSEMPSGKLEWSSLLFVSQAEAETVWESRAKRRHYVRSVHTMLDPSGKIIRVKFN